MARTIRLILKGLGWLLLALLLAILAFAALNWTMARNMLRASGKANVEVAQLQPVQPVSGCGVRAIPVAAESPIPAQALAKMQAFSDKSKGIGLIVLHDGKLIYERYAKGVDGKTLTQTHSMNKSVTALAVGVALGDGALASIDTALGAAIPEWKGDGRKGVTLRQLLAMSSGIENVSMVQGDWAAMKLILSDEIEETAIGLPLARKPGSEFRYSNGDAQRAGAVLRRAIAKAHKGESYASYLSRTLWCGAGNAPATLWAESADGAPRFFAGLQAGLYDWARLGQLILDKGQAGGKQVVPAAWIAEMTRPSAANPNYGLLVWLGNPADGSREYSPEAGPGVRHSARYAAPDAIFFDGFGGQRVYIVPSAKLVIARTGETDMDWDDAPLVNLALAGLVETSALPLPKTASSARP